MSSQKNWSTILSEIESVLNSSEDFDAESLLDRFENVDEQFRDQHFSRLYLKFWKIAKAAGKLNLANDYAKKSIEYLLSLKRIPKTFHLLDEMQAEGILKKSQQEFRRKCQILLGRKQDFHKQDLKYFDLMDDHPEHWKEFQDYLKQYLLIVTEWGIEEWKLCYEYILLHHFDTEIAYALMQKAFEMGRSDLVKKFEELFARKKIRVKKLVKPLEIKTEALQQKLRLDYDQVAMELLSGEKSPDDEEQTRVLNSLKFITDEELKTRGHDMVVAFELLGMEKVVLALCERVIELTEDIKARASLLYIRAQALFNAGESFKTIDLVDEVLSKEPLYDEERIAFLYLKAEACVKVKKIKIARDIFATIKKHNPHYRMVGERLKSLETT